MQAITRFMNTADHEDSVPKVEVQQPKYSSYQLNEDEWEVIKIIYEVLKVYFSAVRFPGDG